MSTQPPGQRVTGDFARIFTNGRCKLGRGALAIHVLLALSMVVAYGGAPTPEPTRSGAFALPLRYRLPPNRKAFV